MNEVPVMISTKDLAYLSDMFEWQSVLTKVINHYKEEVQDEEIKSLFNNVAAMLKDNCQKIVDILGGMNNE
ncbi:MAG: hypothetical protein PHE54_01690 [Bacilli bacterium]|nr:hypothetical protein [Bacilli bacterium]